MAQYLPFIPEVFPEPALYKPDMNFFERMLQRKQALYDEGINKARYAYNSVLNAPLSDKANIPLRDQYIKEAKDKLKNMSSLDFSLPQNVQSAESIFSPFWEDEKILKDANLTKWFQSQYQVMDGWRNSSDPKIRSQYNGIAQKYLDNELEKLSNAGRNDDVYNSIQRRRATPFQNVEEYLDAQAEKEPDKLKIVWDTQAPGGAYMVSRINGERSKKNFATWAHSKMGNNFYDQYNVIGTVTAEDEMKILRQKNPNATEAQLRELLANSVVSELEEGYTTRRNDIKMNMEKIKSYLKAIPDNFDESKKSGYDQLKLDLQNYQSQLDDLDVEYKFFDQPAKDRRREAVLNNPNGYFATLAKQRTVDNWSTGRAAAASMKIDKDDAWFQQAQIENERARIEISKQTLELDRNYKNWEMTGGKKPAGPTKKTTTTDANGNVVTVEEPVIEGTDKDSGGRYIGRGTTDITKNAPLAWDRFVNYQSDIYRATTNGIFGATGALYFAKDLNLSQREIASVSSWEKKRADNPFAKVTQEESAAMDKFVGALSTDPAVKALGIPKGGFGPTNIRSAYLAYLESHLKERSEKMLAGTDIPPTKEETNALLAYTNSRKLLDAYTANEENKRQLIESNILNNKEFAKLVVDRNGKKDLMTAKDLAQHFSVGSIEAEDDAGNKVMLSKDDIALAYMSGKVRNYETTAGQRRMTGTNPNIFYDGRTINKDGVDYHVYAKVDVTGGQPMIYGSKKFGQFQGDIMTMEKTYGNSQQFNKLFNSANEKIVPNLMFYQNQSGKIGSVFSYNFDTKTENDPAAMIFIEAMQPANVAGAGITFENEVGEAVAMDPKYQNAVRMMLSAKEPNIEKFIGGFEYSTIGQNGKPTITFSLNPIAANSKEEIGGIPLTDLAANKIRVELANNANGPMMSRLPNPTGQYVYGKLYQGESISADPVLKAAGFDFTIDPDNTSNPEYVIMNGSFQQRILRDPKTNELVNRLETVPLRRTFYLRGPEAKNPDEIVNFINGLMFDVLDSNQKVNDEYQRLVTKKGGQGGTVPATVYSKSEYLKDVKL